MEEAESSAARSKAVIENPCLADWFFYHHVNKFMDAFFIDTLKANDYWFRFEYQHRGSPHVHGVAWLQNAPNIQSLIATDSIDQLITYTDRTVSTINPVVLCDGSNISDAPLPKIDPHICNKKYSDIQTYSNCHMSEAHKMLCCLLFAYKRWSTAMSLWLPQTITTTDNDYYQ